MELKTKLKALLAIVSVAKFIPVLKWVPGLGPVAGIASSALGAVIALVKGTFKGVTIIFTNPATLLVVGFVALSALAVGLMWGSEEGRTRVAAMQQERDAAYADGQRRLNEALAAREAAEREETKKLTADQPSMAPKGKPASNRPRPERVRKSADADRDGFCLPGVPSVWPKC